MPTTFDPAKNEASPRTNDIHPHDPASFLKVVNRQAYNQVDEMLQSSLPSEAKVIYPLPNGFVSTVLDAYNTHKALIIRPDDVWLAILTQFNFFITGNAEKLRHLFVAHEGQKRLELQVYGTRYTVDYGEFAKQMTAKIHENVVDPELRSWIIPSFSTTEDNDRVVASIVMLSTLKSYFSYVGYMTCGLPRVTLEGEKSDWEEILTRAAKLKEYGEQTEAWYKLLEPVLTRFVRAFDSPDSKENLDFWQRVAHYSSGGSGPTYLSGWITAFCVFNAQGKWLGNKPGTLIPTPAESVESKNNPDNPRSKLVIDGAHYHVIDSQNIPSSNVAVDIQFNDHDEKLNCGMVAGLIGAQIFSTKDKLLGSGIRDGVRPFMGWWMFTKRPEGSIGRADEEEAARIKVVKPEHNKKKRRK